MLLTGGDFHGRLQRTADRLSYACLFQKAQDLVTNFKEALQNVEQVQSRVSPAASGNISR